MQSKLKKTRAELNARWIEKYCLIPTGPRKGSRVVLNQDQRELLSAIYDGDAVRSIPVIGPMGAFLALLHTVGREAPQGNDVDELPEVAVDPWSLWSATSPKLQEYLERDGAGAIICPGLGLRFPRRAA